MAYFFCNGFLDVLASILIYIYGRGLAEVVVSMGC